MNILITGHTGFLGKEVVNLLSKSRSNNIYGVSRSILGNLKCAEYAFDISNLDKLKKIIAEKNIDVVIHLAGKPTVQDCENDPYGAFTSNSLGTASVLEACRLTQVTKVISVETDKVYGLQNQEIVNEESTLNPHSPYELSKAIASNFADFYRKYYNMNIISVRPVNLIGGNDPNSTRILPRSFKSIRDKKPISIYEDSVNSYREFVYVKDVALALEVLLNNNPKEKIYNISPGKCIKIKDFVDRVLLVTGCDISPTVVKKSKEFTEIPYQSIDGSRFIEEFNFNYTNLDIILKESFQEFLNLNCA